MKLTNCSLDDKLPNVASARIPTEGQLQCTRSFQSKQMRPDTQGGCLFEIARWSMRYSPILLKCEFKAADEAVRGNSCCQRCKVFRAGALPQQFKFRFTVSIDLQGTSQTYLCVADARLLFQYGFKLVLAHANQRLSSLNLIW